ncbi:MAG: spinster family MFS transporter [Gammaproteobacteria bacterium]
MKDAAPESSALPSFAARWYVLIMMVLVYTLSIADRYVMSTVLEPIRLELQLSDSGIAFLTGVSLALFYVVFGFPLSWLIDRGNRRNIIAISVIVWSAMTTFCGMAQNYWHLLIARIGVGIGEAGGTPGASSLLSDYFPAHRRPMALTIFSLGAPIGAWLGADVAGSIADEQGWRGAFLWLGIPGVIFGVLLWLTVREPRRGQFDEAEKSALAAPSFMETVRWVWTQRSAFHVIMASGVSALWGWGLLWWTPAFLMRSYGLSAGEAGDILGPIHLVGGALATAATGWLLAHPAMVDPRRVMRFMGVIIGAATLVSFVAYWTRDLGVATLMFWIFIPAIYFYIGPTFGLLNNLVEPRMRAMACAMLLFVANVFNLIVAPQAVGLASDWLAPGGVANAESLRLALLWLVPTGLWATWHFFAGLPRMLEDQRKATGVGLETR